MVTIRTKKGRNFTFGPKIYGADAVYQVSEEVARELRKLGKAEIIEGDVPEDSEERTSRVETTKFLKLIKENAGLIVQLLQESQNVDEEVVEPSTTTIEPGTELPEDFPGRENLIKAGFDTLDKVPNDKDELMKVKQMTERTATQIGIQLEKLTSTEKD